MTSPLDEGAGSHAVVVGVGLIGGSIALALREQGWHVSGVDPDEARLDEALDRGILDAIGDDPRASLFVIATPAGAVVETAHDLLRRHGDDGVLVTDVAGIKAAICSSIDDPRFIGGHPMAGSEQAGLDGARADLFVGASWVLTPGPSTPPGPYAAPGGRLEEHGRSTSSP